MKGTKYNAADWHEHAVIYNLFLRLFTPEGTLNAAEKQLPRLAGLGVNVIYLSPVVLADDDMDRRFWSRRTRESGTGNPRNPYRTKDFFAIDPEYGTAEDLKSFLSVCHKLGMKALVDIVYLHCGPRAVHIQEHPDFVLRNPDGTIRAGEEWPFARHDFGNPGLREYLISNMEFWLREFGFDGFRCDSADKIPLDFWREARTRVEKIRPDVIIVGETNGTRPGEQDHAIDASFGYARNGYFYNLLRYGDSPAAYREHHEQLAGQCPGGVFVNYEENHDIANDLGENRFERTCPPGKTDAVFFLSVFLDGIPFLYNGCEIADGAPQTFLGRRGDPGHTPIDWTPTPRGMERTALVRELLSIRKKHPQFRAKAPLRWVDNPEPDQLMTFIRDESMFVCANLFEGTHTMPLPFPAAPVWTRDCRKADDTAVIMDSFGVGIFRKT